MVLDMPEPYDEDMVHKHHPGVVIGIVDAGIQVDVLEFLEALSTSCDEMRTEGRRKGDIPTTSHDATILTGIKASSRRFCRAPRIKGSRWL
jgi:hypothetical protein